MLYSFSLYNWRWVSKKTQNALTFKTYSKTSGYSSLEQETTGKMQCHKFCSLKIAGLSMYSQQERAFYLCHGFTFWLCVCVLFLAGVDVVFSLLAGTGLCFGHCDCVSYSHSIPEAGTPLSPRVFSDTTPSESFLLCMCMLAQSPGSYRCLRPDSHSSLSPLCTTFGSTNFCHLKKKNQNKMHSHKLSWVPKAFSSPSLPELREL